MNFILNSKSIRMVISTIFFFVALHVPILELQASNSSSDLSSAQDRYRDAVGEYSSDSVEHNQNLRHGEATPQIGDPRANVNNGESAYVERIVIDLIIFIVAATVSIAFIVQCVNQPSSWIMLIGAATYFAGEIASWVGYQSNVDALNVKLVALSKVTQEGKNIQVEAINEDIKLHRAAKEHTEIKLVLQVIATVIFFVAAIVALIEGILKQIPTVNYNDTCSGSDTSTKAEQITWSKMGFLPQFTAILSAIMPAIEQFFNTGEQNGFVRAIVFAVVGVIAVTSCVITEERLQLINRRIAVLSDLADQIEVVAGHNTDGLTKNTDGSSNNSGNAPPPSPTEVVGTDDLLTGKCSSMNKSNVESVDCSQCTNDSCSPDLSAATTEGFSAVSFPSNVGTTISTAKQGAKDLFNGRGLGREMRAIGTTNSLKAIRKSLGDVAGNANEFLKSKNLGEINLPAQVLAKSSELRGSVKNAIDGLSADDKKLLLSDALGLVNPSNDKQLTKTQDTLSKFLPASLQLPSNLNSGPKINLGSDSKINFDNQEVSSADELKGLKYDNQDIVKETGVPIWTVISNRYRKSAYRHFFTEDRVESKK